MSVQSELEKTQSFTPDWLLIAQAYTSQYFKDGKPAVTRSYALPWDLASKVDGWGKDFQERIQWQYSEETFVKKFGESPVSGRYESLLKRWPNFMTVDNIVRTAVVFGYGAVSPEAKAYLRNLGVNPDDMKASIPDALAGLADVRVIEQDSDGRVQERGLSFGESLIQGALTIGMARAQHSLANELIQQEFQEIALDMQRARSSVWQTLRPELLSLSESDEFTPADVAIYWQYQERSFPEYVLAVNKSKRDIDHCVLILESKTKSTSLYGFFIKDWKDGERLSLPIFREDL